MLQLHDLPSRMVWTGYSHHIGEAVQQQLSELTNGSVSASNGLGGTASGPSSGSGASANGDENGYVPQGYDDDQNYHSLTDNGTQPAYVENSPEFYSPPLMDKAFQQGTFITKSFGRTSWPAIRKSDRTFFEGHLVDRFERIMDPIVCLHFFPDEDRTYCS